MAPKKKILVVDDEEGFLSLVKHALEIRGFEIIVAANAVEAGIELANELASELPNLILMDVKMLGIDGLQACEAIKNNPLTKNIPIIIISALSDEPYKRKAREIGVVEYFVKPLNMDKFIKKVKETLALKSA